MAIIVLSLQHGFRVAGGCACGRTKGLSDRPLETFGSHLSLLSFIESFLVSVLFVLSGNIKIQEIGVCAAKGWRGRPQSPLLASAEAKSLRPKRTVREAKLFLFHDKKG